MDHISGFTLTHVSTMAAKDNLLVASGDTREYIQVASSPELRRSTAGDGKFVRDKCDSFFWIDAELNSYWYKHTMYEMYVTMNSEEREVFESEVNRQEMEIYKAEMEAELEKTRAKLCKWRRMANFMMIMLIICFALLLAVL